MGPSQYYFSLFLQIIPGWSSHCLPKVLVILTSAPLLVLFLLPRIFLLSLFLNQTPSSLKFFFFLNNSIPIRFVWGLYSLSIWTSLVVQTVKNLHTTQETQVQSLGQEDPLEKGMATHSSIHAWRIPWTEEPGGLQSTGSQRVRHD